MYIKVKLYFATVGLKLYDKQRLNCIIFDPDGINCYESIKDT